MTIQVRDDSDSNMGIMVIPELEVDEFVEQLPEGWYIEILSTYY